MSDIVSVESDEEFCREALQDIAEGRGGPELIEECLRRGADQSALALAQDVGAERARREAEREKALQRALAEADRLAEGTAAEASSFLPSVQPCVEKTKTTPSVERGPITLEPGAPFDSARIFVGARYMVGGVLTLRCHQEQFYAWRWSGKHYRPADEGTLRADIYEFLDKAVMRQSGGSVRFRPDQAKVTKVLDALRAVTNLRSEITAPAWLSGDPPIENVRELLACQNGLLHLPTRTLHPHNPRFWSHNVLEFEFDEEAECPRWLQFVDEVWPNDLEAVRVLQEIFGLCITDETRFQKAFLLIGPKRSGKGTIARVLRGLVGPENYVGPTLSGFVRQHGMQSWIGKKVAVFSDARIDTASTVVTERLLSIIGEDVLDVERKYLGAWIGILPTRIIILTNELPRFNDDSGALPGRIVVLEIHESFYGREDIDLTDKLLKERSGILNWALDGWDNLRTRKHFVQPESGREAAESLAVIASNIKSFVEEKCELAPEYEIECKKLHDAWRMWKGANEIRLNLLVNQFSARLKSAFPQIRTERPRDEDDPRRPRYFAGIRLKKQFIRRI